MYHLLLGTPCNEHGGGFMNPGLVLTDCNHILGCSPPPCNSHHQAYQPSLATLPSCILESSKRGTLTLHQPIGCNPTLSLVPIETTQAQYIVFEDDVKTAREAELAGTFSDWGLPKRSSTILTIIWREACKRTDTLETHIDCCCCCCCCRSRVCVCSM